MFESGGKYAPRRPVEPPRSVLVDLARLFPPARFDWGRDTPMWARAQGLRVDRLVRAEVSEWVVTGVGDWVAVCRGVHLVVGGTDLVVDLLVPAAAIDRSSDAGPPPARS